MKKRKSVAPLLIGLLALACGIAACIPMLPLETHPNVSFYSYINVILAGASAVLGLIALITGIVGIKRSEKKATSVIGLILGILMLICGIIGTLAGFAAWSLRDYIDEKPDNALSQSLSEADRQKLDEALNQLFAQIEK